MDNPICLPCEHEDLTSIPITHWEKKNQGMPLVILVPERQRQWSSEALWPAPSLLRMLQANKKSRLKQKGRRFLNNNF